MDSLSNHELLHVEDLAITQVVEQNRSLSERPGGTGCLGSQTPNLIPSSQHLITIIYSGWSFNL